MREIKFRAWDVENEKMIKNYAHISEYGQFYTAWTSTDREREYIPMQYTGLKDKNGKEIYENDIVKTQYGNRSIYCRLGCWFVEGEKELGYYDEMPEVIGNIYENPELLKGGE